MSILTEYKNLSCYTKMDKVYQDSFDHLASNYGEQLNKGFLNQGVPSNGKLFTLHDFDHHCINIMKIVSELFFDNGGAYCHIKSKELYILNISILFHDISMAVNSKWKREIHSQQSAEFLEGEYGNSSSTLYSQEQHLRENDVEAIKQIIFAHSDIKDGNIEEQRNGLNNPLLLNEMDGTTKIRAKLLAGVLRLADEFDITRNRLGNAIFERQLDEFSEDISESISYTHWKRLHYFSSAIVNANITSQVDLIIADKYVLREINQGDELNVIKSIIDVERTLNAAIQKIAAIAFAHYTGFQAFAPIKNVKLVSTEDLITSAITAEKSRQNMQPTYGATDLTPAEPNTTQAKGGEHQDAESKLFTLEKPVLLNPSLQDTITKEVDNRNLIKGGHYPLNEKYCACDWIDTHELIETGEMADICVGAFVDHLKKDIFSYENCLVLGLDGEGTLLASKMAFQLQKPFSYVIPATAFEESIELEKKLDMDDYKEIIIVTDAIATWETINTVINHYNMQDKIVRIYTIFYRKPNIENVNDLVDITFALNEAFPVQIMSKCEKANSLRCISNNKKRGQ